MPVAAHCFDTSAFLQCWARYYPPDVFSGLWEKLNDYAAHQAIVAPDEVRFEIEKQDDGLHEWVKARPYLFVSLDEEIQRAASSILAAYPLLVKASAQRTQADAFVIALAQTRRIPVVTEERGGSPNKPKIPSVCAALGIPCMTVVQFIRSQGWQFS
jgi:hypothetical protein